MKTLMTILGLVLVVSTNAKAMEIMDLKAHLGPNAPITIYPNFGQWQVQGGIPGNVWDTSVDDMETGKVQNIVHVLKTLCAPLSIRIVSLNPGSSIYTCVTK